jgi:hypothetical protein
MFKKAGRSASLIATCGVLVGAGVGMSFAMAGPSNDGAVVSAALAPFYAFARQNADELCAAFAPPARRLIAIEQTAKTCPGRVRKALRGADAIDTKRAWEIARSIRISAIEIHGDRASARLRYRHHRRGALKLIRGQGRWLIATKPIFRQVSACHGSAEVRDCSKRERVIVFGFSR